MKKTLCFIILSGFALMLCACAWQSASPSPSPAATAAPAPTQESDPPAMARFLPTQEGYRWAYSGFAQYAHTMAITRIEKAPGQWQWQVRGEVADASAGETESELAVELRYTATENTLTQESMAPMMMDSGYEKLELLRAPVKEGASWQQDAQSADGKAVPLTCTIEKVGAVEEKEYVIVRYEDPSSGYYERRVLLEGAGLAEFSRLAMPGEGQFTMGFCKTDFSPLLKDEAADAADPAKDKAQDAEKKSQDAVQKLP